MKFSEYLNNMENAALFPIISLIIFGVVFLIVLLYAFTSSQSKMDSNANIPLNNKNDGL